MMKNILNIGVLIVFIQSVDWLKKDREQGKDQRIFSC